MPTRYVIAGGGLAAVEAAQTIRENDPNGSVCIVSSETELPYIRPPLSKQYLQGTVPQDSVFPHDAHWYSEQNIDLELGAKVMRCERDRNLLELDNGHTASYDRLLIATGSSARTLHIPGAQNRGIFMLRNLSDCEHIKVAFDVCESVAIVGAGWIGLEVAAAARLAGLAVHIFEVDDVPLMRTLGPRIGSAFSRLHEDHGVEMHCGVTVEEFESSKGEFNGVRLSNADLIPADMAVVGIGALPNVQFAQESGIRVENGIITDEQLRTSQHNVFAAGDVAKAYHPFYETHIRVEHWDNAKRQGVAAAHGMLGNPIAYDALPFFYSDQYDLGLEYVGWAPPGTYDDVIIRGDLDAFHFVAFWLREGRVQAAMHANVWEALTPIKSLITSRVQVREDQLRNERISLSELIAA